MQSSSFNLSCCQVESVTGIYHQAHCLPHACVCCYPIVPIVNEMHDLCMLMNMILVFIVIVRFARHGKIWISK